MSSTDGVPFAQWAGIHRNEKFISVEPLSGCSRTLPEDADRIVYLEADAAEEALGKSLLEALNRSRFVDPDVEPEFFEADRIVRADKRWHNDFMARFGYENLRQAYAHMCYCLATRCEGKISIKPYRRDAPRYWRDLPNDMTVVIAATVDPSTAGAALKLALSRSETDLPGGLGVDCTWAGISLAGVPLLCDTTSGLGARPMRELAGLMQAAYGRDVRLPDLLDGLAQVARALNDGNLIDAKSAALLMRLPELTLEAAARLDEVQERLAESALETPTDRDGRDGTDAQDALVSRREPGRTGVGAICTAAGLSLAGVPLVHRTETGFAPRPGRELVALIRAAYAVDVRPGEVWAALEPVARALTRGELARAKNAAVLVPLPELDAEAAARLAEAQQRLATQNPDGSTSGDPSADGGLAAPQDHDADVLQMLEILHQILASKYDWMGAADFANGVVEYGEWLEKDGRGLNSPDREMALAEFAFLQDRLEFWLGYGHKPAGAQRELRAAALALNCGAVKGGVVVVGARRIPVPQSRRDAKEDPAEHDRAQPLAGHRSSMVERLIAPLKSLFARR